MRKEIGPIATPDHIQFTDGLPKTRSGKIMRRILRKIAENDFGSLGDTSTLADPTLVDRLVDGRTRVTTEMVDGLERLIDSMDERFVPPTEFVVPGQNRVSALLDVGRTVARRAERHSLAAAPPPSQACPYLNRLSDLLWTLARWQEGESLPVKDVR